MRKILLVLVLASTPAVAQEPLTLFGIPFNQPLTLPECPWKEVRDFTKSDRRATRREYDNLTFSENLCFAQYPNIGQPVSEGSVSFIFPLRDRPSMGGVGGRIVDGRLQRLQINTRGIDAQARDYEALVEKFGQPSSADRPEAQNRMGATFTTIEALWKLPDETTVVYSSALTKITEGVVIVSTPQGHEAHQKAQQDRRQQLGGTKL